ncbi:hypothetical protein F6O75_05915 [Streptococcus suis]|uniref:Membrane protein n=2 Tax=Streptococcus suis TaxID=1307 RepID=A0A0H3N5X2_STRS4|nr:membrane protein [Streptococcus suis]CAR47262.1 putative membrane protein [Streptococcus suis P1/7]CAZ52366.1 putative membrane protein [Streptococcus suis SC84]CAZ56494.1 putative membrane protein [Streptococcus suis BM407]ARL70549.1 hypothetical protein B9H01_08475 [Streptococcus suis]
MVIKNNEAFKKRKKSGSLRVLVVHFLSFVLQYLHLLFF